MKLGLLTFHTAANFGAALQAYALQEFLVSEGYDAEYIDYQNSHRRMIYDMPFHIKENIKNGKVVEALVFAMGAPIMKMRKMKFEKFDKEYLRLSSRTYYTKEQLEAVNDMYDMFIVGSDQVWHSSNNGADTSYMLSFVKDESKTISYASSFGLSEVPEFIKNDYAQSLKRIAHLSTREQTGVIIIKDMTGRDAKLVLDPVFLLKKEQWQKLAAKNAIEGKYLFSYTNRKNQMDKFLGTGYDMRGMKHHKLSRFTGVKDFLSPSVKVKYDMSPTEFLANVNGAQMVVSASFHCICFSIIMNKPFICFLTGNDGKDERLKTLLTHFGLMNRVYHEGMTLAEVQKEIDWQKVNSLMDEKRMESIDFLLKSIKRN